MIQKIDQEIVDHGYFVENLLEKSVEQVQRGVFRTNCLDSLDRTNVAQSKVAMVALQIQMKKLGFDLERCCGPAVHTDGIAFMYEPNSTSVI